jgi:hypothetical protein
MIGDRELRFGVHPLGEHGDQATLFGAQSLGMLIPNQEYAGSRS